MRTLGIEDLDALFAEMQDHVENADYTETLEGFQQTIAEQEAGMFAGEYDSNLVSWSELKPSTIKRKGHDRILVETGALRESLVHVGGTGNIHSATSRQLVYGTSDEHAIFHQFGTRKMAARPPVGLTEDSLRKLTDNVADATVEILMRG